MIDLHAHTTASDGELSPSELIDLAIKIDITTLAITDHDNINGLEEACEYAKGKNINLIPGIEIQAKFSPGKMHILGLFVDYKNADFVAKLDKVVEYRNARNANFIRELNNMGYSITEEELKKEAGGDIIGKPHFARVFIKKGYTNQHQRCLMNSLIKNH